MRLDEIQAIVKRHFENALADHSDRLNAKGMTVWLRERVEGKVGILQSDEMNGIEDLSDFSFPKTCSKISAPLDKSQNSCSRRTNLTSCARPAEGAEPCSQRFFVQRELDLVGLWATGLFRL